MSVKRVIDNKKIGANIRLARVKKMMSQSELAKLLGVTQTHMSNLERGRCGITVTMLNELTNIFEVETDALLYKPMHFYMVPPGPIRIQALQVLLKTAE